MPLNDTYLQEELLRLTETLIRFRTVDGNDSAMQQAARFVKEYFKNIPVKIEEFNFNGYPALVITTKDTRTPKIFFQGHLDVVDGKAEQFESFQDADKLYGRGSVDMKGFDALSMHLLRQMAIQHPEADLGLMLTFDEEIGSPNGASQLAEAGFVPQLLINGDGGYNDAVIHAEKGILKIKLIAQTTAGRHPFPWEGDNAFDRLLSVYEKIKARFPMHPQASDLNNWFTTYSAYDIQIKNNESTMPHYAEMKVNIYFTEDIAAGALFDQLTELCDEVQIQKLTVSERVYLPADDEHVLRFRSILEKQYGRPVVVRSENGSSDARFYAHKYIPILIVKVVGEGHHTENEYLHIPSFVPLYHALEEFVLTELTEKYAETATQGRQA